MPGDGCSDYIVTTLHGLEMMVGDVGVVEPYVVVFEEAEHAQLSEDPLA